MLRSAVTLEVHLLTGRTLHLSELKASDSVWDIKRAVERVEGIEAEAQRLIFKGNELLDAQSIDESGLTSGSSLNLVLTKHKARAKGLLFLTFFFVFCGRLKHACAHNTTAKGKGDSLIKPSIAKARAAAAGRRESGEVWKMRVNLITGRVLHVSAKPSDPILEVKKQVEAIEGFAVATQQLLYKRKKLERDEVTVAQYGLKNGAKMALVLLRTDPLWTAVSAGDLPQAKALLESGVRVCVGACVTLWVFHWCLHARAQATK